MQTEPDRQRVAVRAQDVVAVEGHDATSPDGLQAEIDPPFLSRGLALMRALMTEPVTEPDGVVVHQFESTGAAYDACQVGIARVGDVLVVESEGVVGLADTWPVALTSDCGDLHKALSETAFAKFSDASVRRALEVAGALGFPLAWSPEQLEVKVASRMSVELGHCPNPDIRDLGGYWGVALDPPGPERVKVADLKEARDACLRFIKRNGLGGGNWDAGKVFVDERQIAAVSYNGRIWNPEQQEIAEERLCLSADHFLQPADMRVLILVEGIATCSDDEAIPGSYEVVFPGPVPGHELADAALGSFHDSFAIDCLDDFDVTVLSTSGAALEPWRSGYDSPFRGEVERLPDADAGMVPGA